MWFFLAMTLTTIKTLAALTILLVTLLSAWWPLNQKLKAKSPGEFVIGEALASGVFLGAGLLHMLGEHHHTLNTQYPIDFLLAGIRLLSFTSCSSSSFLSFSKLYCVASGDSLSFLS